jgi:hypothetical protein
MHLNLPEKSHFINTCIDMGDPIKNEFPLRFSATLMPGQTNKNLFIYARIAGVEFMIFFETIALSDVTESRPYG